MSKVGQTGWTNTLPLQGLLDCTYSSRRLAKRMIANWHPARIILLWVAWLVLGALAVLFAARLDIGESATRNFYLVPSVAAWIVLGAVPFTLTWIWQKNKGRLIMAWAAWIALALLAPFSEVRTFLVVWTLFGIVPFALN